MPWIVDASHHSSFFNTKDLNKAMNNILEKLTGGDRRSIGRSNEVVNLVLRNPKILEIVFEGLLSDDPVLRMRCADVLEKVTALHPEYLDPYKERLIREISMIEQQEVRWHVAQMFSRIDLNQDERQAIVEVLSIYLKDESKIVKTFSMQALADIAEQDTKLRPIIIGQLEVLTEKWSPAMKSRGRKLLSRLRNR